MKPRIYAADAGLRGWLMDFRLLEWRTSFQINPQHRGETLRHGSVQALHPGDKDLSLGTATLGRPLSVEAS